MHRPRRINERFRLRLFLIEQLASANTHPRQNPWICKLNPAVVVHFWISNEFTRECFPYIAHVCLDRTTVRTKAVRNGGTTMCWPEAKHRGIARVRSYVCAKFRLVKDTRRDNNDSRHEKYDTARIWNFWGLLSQFFPSWYWL